MNRKIKSPVKGSSIPRSAAGWLVGWVFLLLPLAATAGPLDQSCIVGQRPAATLLFPYFEVDLDNPVGPTTLISINNAATTPTVAHVVVWTDCHLPIFAFDIYLGGNDVAPINLRDILVNGNLPTTNPGIDGLAAFPGCADPVANPPLDGAAIATLQAQLTGQPAPSDGFCYGSERDQSRVAAGFLTVDALNDCSTTIRFPDDDGYFVAGGNGLASNDNVLWGDAYLVNPGQDFAQGFEAVSVVADPDRFTGTDIRSFYQVTADERDDRVPLSSKLRTRTLAGGAFDAGTQLLVWINRAPSLLPFTCGVDNGNCPQTDKLRSQFDFYDEDSQLSAAVVTSPPAFASRLEVTDLAPSADFGFVQLNSTAALPVGVALEQRQAWMLQTSSAENRFSVGLSSTRLDDLCKLDDQGE